MCAYIGYRNMIFAYSGFCEYPFIGTPEIQLVFPVFFFIKQLRPVRFVKVFPELLYHIPAHFIAVLADGRTDGTD